MKTGYIYRAQKHSFIVNELISEQSRYKTQNFYSYKLTAFDKFIFDIEVDIVKKNKYEDPEFQEIAKFSHDNDLLIIDILFKCGYLSGINSDTNQIKINFFAFNYNNGIALLLKNSNFILESNIEYSNNSSYIHEFIVDFIEPTIIKIKNIQKTDVLYLDTMISEIMQNKQVFFEELYKNYTEYLNNEKEIIQNEMQAIAEGYDFEFVFKRACIIKGYPGQPNQILFDANILISVSRKDYSPFIKFKIENINLLKEFIDVNLITENGLFVELNYYPIKGKDEENELCRDYDQIINIWKKSNTFKIEYQESTYTHYTILELTDLVRKEIELL